MQPDYLTPDYFFEVAVAVFEKMTGVSPDLGELSDHRLERSEHDLTVRAAIAGARRADVRLGFDRDSLLKISRAIMKSEAGLDLPDSTPEEGVDLLRGTAEELANRILAATVNGIGYVSGEDYELVAPHSTLGKGNDLGPALEGKAARLESSLGSLWVFFAPETK